MDYSAHASSDASHSRVYKNHMFTSTTIFKRDSHIDAVYTLSFRLHLRDIKRNRVNTKILKHIREHLDAAIRRHNKTNTSNKENKNIM